MRRRTKFVLVGGATLLAVGAGGAFAYWTQGGTGTGTASLGTTSPITVLQTTVITGLVPGGTAVTVSGNFNNTNPSPITISAVTATVQAFSSKTDPAKPACTEADFLIGGTAAGSVVPAGSAVGAWTGLTVQMKNLGTNQDNCKGQLITLLYTAAP